jgi:hypothetical protein
MTQKVISLCDRTGNMVKPWAESGYDCICVDFQHAIRRTRTVEHGKGTITYEWGDVRSWWPDRDWDVAIVFGAPECTLLAVSGSQDWPKKGLNLLIDALALVEACRKIGECSGAPWMIENPVGRLSSLWRKPDYIFQPWNFGDLYQKRTCLWTNDKFVMPEFQITEKPEEVTQDIFKMTPSPDRADLRSVTPMGFSKAVFEANHNE